MNILALMPYSPVPPIFGGALRMYHILKWMATHHDVTLCLFGQDEDLPAVTREFPQLANRVHVLPRPLLSLDRWKRIGQGYAILRKTSYTRVAVRSEAMQCLVNDLLDTSEYHLIKIFFPGMGFFQFNSSASRVLDSANVEYDVHRRVAMHSPTLLRRWWSTNEYRMLCTQEIAICREQNAILLASERDRSLLDNDVPGVAKFVVPNGVDPGYFHVSGPAKEPHALVFTGAINYLPNADGVEYFVREILPLIRKEVPDVVFYAVGSSPPASVRRLASDHVFITGSVPDVRPYVQRASVFVVPLRTGGGTRLKVLEAMSMQRPIVTTSIGYEGIDAHHEESLLVGDDPPAFAAQVVRAFRDSSLREKLVRNGYDLVRAQYEWSKINVHLENAYRYVADVARQRRMPS
jgi:polysaccharide biosynthesis protein PslH